MKQTETPKKEGIEQKKHSGVVTIIGRPSAGKSSFLNAVCGGKVSIVSPIPQTTRKAVRGIITNDVGQILFLDTPGLHESDKRFNEELRRITSTAVKESDAVLYIIDSTRAFGNEEEKIFQLIQKENLSDRLVIAINKCDEKNSQSGIIFLTIEKFFPQLQTSTRVFEISAKQKKGLEALIDALMKLLPYGELMYPPDFYTDQDIAFRISEIIREKAIENTREEIPHALYVLIDTLQMKANGKELFVKAFICVERESQKGIVIGKNARVIRAIKEQSLKELQKIFSYHILLSLQVRVDKDWRKNSKVVDKLLT